jgi:hypothetical protein
LVDGRGEYQVGLQLLSQESDPWGMSLAHSNAQSATRSSAFSGAA